mmetsp:Transcript_25862/g.40567  ORF Transcript_25862/g.40567 Transcript_25862/m.40567 type:complete len:350 (-) Transcript_25862:2557-3606(-)
MVNSKLRVSRNIGQVLRGDEDELSMFHFFGYINQSFEGKLSSYRIEENIKLVHHTERCLKALPNGEEQGKSSETPFTTAQCLDIFGLSTFISVVLLNDEIQLTTLMIKLYLSSTLFLLQKVIKRDIRHLSNVTSKENPPLFTFLHIINKHIHVLLDSFDLVHFGIQSFLCSKVLISRHSRISFGQIPSLLLSFNFLLFAGNPRLASLCIMPGHNNFDGFKILFARLIIHVIITTNRYATICLFGLQPLLFKIGGKLYLTSPQKSVGDNLLRLGDNCFLLNERIFPLLHLGSAFVNNLLTSVLSLHDVLEPSFNLLHVVQNLHVPRGRFIEIFLQLLDFRLQRFDLFRNG